MDTPGASDSANGIMISWPVEPITRWAASGSFRPASATTILLPLSLRISGSDTPSLSTRFLMMLTDWLSWSAVIVWPFSGFASSVTSVPPCRSSPSTGLLKTAAKPAPMRAAMTTRRIRLLRARSVTLSVQAGAKGSKHGPV